VAPASFDDVGSASDALRAAIGAGDLDAAEAVSCLDAASLDPEHRSLYVAAAAYLSGWWAMRPATDDPILT
jgi:hypothetical protein